MASSGVKRGADEGGGSPPAAAMTSDRPRRAGDATAAAVGRRVWTVRGATHADAADSTQAAETVKAGAIVVSEMVDVGNDSSGDGNTNTGSGRRRKGRQQTEGSGRKGSGEGKWEVG